MMMMMATIVIRTIRRNLFATSTVVAKARVRLDAAVRSIANGVRDKRHPPTSLEFALVPLLHLASIAYCAASSLLRFLYRDGLLSQTRVKVPVISIGNVTWGGNGKTPMAEFIARRCLLAGSRPLILERGYGGGDEVRLLRRHLKGSLALIGIGKDRAKVAREAIGQFGAERTLQLDAEIKPPFRLKDIFGWAEGGDDDTDARGRVQRTWVKRVSGGGKERTKQSPFERSGAGASGCTVECCCWEEDERIVGGVKMCGRNAVGLQDSSNSVGARCYEPARASDRWDDVDGDRRSAASVGRRKVGCRGGAIGVVILDDGMQHWKLARDLEVVMVNALSPWGNGHMVPRGPLRERPSAIGRADVVAIHHSNLVPSGTLQELMDEVRKLAGPVALIIKTAMIPTSFIQVGNKSNNTVRRPHREVSNNTTHGDVTMTSISRESSSSSSPSNGDRLQRVSATRFSDDRETMSSERSCAVSASAPFPNRGAGQGTMSSSRRDATMLSSHEAMRCQLQQGLWGSHNASKGGGGGGCGEGEDGRRSCAYEEAADKARWRLSNDGSRNDAHLRAGGSSEGKSVRRSSRRDEDEVVSLSIIKDAVAFCVSGIGCPSSFHFCVKNLGAFHVEALDFGDHHQFSSEDVEAVVDQMGRLQRRFRGLRSVFLVVTEKDYMRDKENIQRSFGPLGALVLRAELQIVRGR